MTDKVEITVGENSVEVDQRFYRIAKGILTMGLPVMDVFQGYPDGPDREAYMARDEAAGEPNDLVSIVFPDSDSMECFSVFLVQHRLFPDEGGLLQVHGHFQIEVIDDDVAATYFISVDPDHLPALESCLVAHTPSLSLAQN